MKSLVFWSACALATAVANVVGTEASIPLGKAYNAGMMGEIPHKVSHGFISLSLKGLSLSHGVLSSLVPAPLRGHTTRLEVTG